MRAEYRTICAETKLSQIQIISNQIEPNYVQVKLATKKYKKVGKQTRSKLIQCLQKGWSIINIAKKFNINYSTAKSIAQHHKKRETSQFPPSEAKVEGRNSSTEQSFDVQVSNESC